jgi:hypothetical protein
MQFPNRTVLQLSQNTLNISPLDFIFPRLTSWLKGAALG